MGAVGVVGSVTVVGIVAQDGVLVAHVDVLKVLAAQIGQMARGERANQVKVELAFQIGLLDAFERFSYRVI